MGEGVFVALLFALIAALAGALGVWVILLRRRAQSAPSRVESVTMVADRVRAVGKLVGLEVHAKEIATSTKGWSWVPPLLLSQARLAMIFHFDKQYFVDLGKLRQSDVQEVADGRYRVRLPGVEGVLRLSDVTPYDIQAGRVLGLLDVIQMNAPTQRELMKVAQEEAAELFRAEEERYRNEAERAVERQLATLLGMFDAEVEVVWPADRAKSTADTTIELAAPVA